MSFPVPIHPAAYAELEAAVEWYEARRQGLGGEFYEAVISALTQGVPLPVSGVAVKSPGVSLHRFLVDRFPYTVVTASREGGERRVVAVAHQRRRPGYWRKRLQPAVRTAGSRTRLSSALGRSPRRT